MLRIKIEDVLEILVHSKNQLTAMHAKSILDSKNLNIVEKPSLFMQHICEGSLIIAYEYANEHDQFCIKKLLSKYSAYNYVLPKDIQHIVDLTFVNESYFSKCILLIDDKIKRLELDISDNDNAKSQDVIDVEYRIHELQSAKRTLLKEFK